MFKPNAKQLAYRELLFSGMPDDKILESLGLTPSDVSAFYEQDGFGEWLWAHLQRMKWKYAARIVLNLFSRALEAKAGFQMMELALRVADVYTPTQKQLNEQVGKIKQKEIEEIKRKAALVKEKRSRLTKIEGGKAA